MSAPGNRKPPKKYNQSKASFQKNQHRGKNKRMEHYRKPSSEHEAKNMQPLQLVSFSEDSLVLNEENLKRLRGKPEIQNRFVSLISINGAFRQGKSFFLNFLLDFLNKKYVKHEIISSDWLTKDDQATISGFSWKHGSSRDTSGILMWPQVFLADLPSGEEVAIFLIDTQGAFDHLTSFNDCATIFAFSTLISSLQIFNVMHQIKLTDLEHLQCFGGLGKLLSTTEEAAPPFQNLLFLVRDWNCPYEKPFGAVGGELLLKEILTEDDSSSPELNAQKRSFKELYEDIKCFLLPYPGEQVDTNPNFTGALKDIDYDFKRHIEELVPSILSPENLVIKKIRGEKVTVADLHLYIREYYNALKDNKLPQPDVLFQATIEARLKSDLEKCKVLYTSIMDRSSDSQMGLLDSVLHDKHKIARAKALDQFFKSEKLSPGPIFNKQLTALKEILEEEFQKYKTKNYEKRQKVKQAEARRLQEEENRRIRHEQLYNRSSNSHVQGQQRQTQAEPDADDMLKALGVTAATVAGIGAVAYGLSQFFGGGEKKDNKK